MSAVQLGRWSQEARARFAHEAARRRDPERLWELVDAYLHDAEHDRRRSVHTLRAYRRGIEELVALWPPGDLLAADADEARRYVASLESGARGPILDEDRAGRRGRRPAPGPLTPATVALRVAAARTLFAALRWSGATDADPFASPASTPATVAAGLRTPGYSPYQLIDLLGHARDDDDRLVLLLGAHAGLRVSEMLALRWDDIDLDAGRIRVPGDDDAVRVSTPLAAALREAARGPQRAAGRPTVLGLRSQHGVYRRVRRLCERAQVPFKGVRGLRHLAGARVVRAGGDAEAVQRHLRLATRSSARRYAAAIEVSSADDA